MIKKSEIIDFNAPSIYEKKKQYQQKMKNFLKVIAVTTALILGAKLTVDTSIHFYEKYQINRYSNMIELQENDYFKKLNKLSVELKIENDEEKKH